MRALTGLLPALLVGASRPARALAAAGPALAGRPNLGSMAPRARAAVALAISTPPSAADRPREPEPYSYYVSDATDQSASTRISLKRLGDLQRLDANGDGVVSVSEAEVALFGEVTPLDEIIRRRTYLIVALVPLVAVAAFQALPEIVDSLSITVIKRITPQSRELSRTLITSVLLPTNSLLFGTLVSTTISRQWERQRRLREELNTELQMLEDLTHSLRVLLQPTPSKMLGALSEVRGYLISLLCECSWRCTDDDRRTLGEDQRNHAWRLHEIIFASVNRQMIERSSMVEPLLINTASATDNLITSLNVVRSRRRSSREGEFPPIHWALLTALGSSVLGAFLVECAGALDESFSEALKVRVAFAFMCAFFVALTALMADLGEAFIGEYRVDVVISNPVRVLKASLKEAAALRRAEMAQKSAPQKPSPLHFEPRKKRIYERLRDACATLWRTAAPPTPTRVTDAPKAGAPAVPAARKPAAALPAGSAPAVDVVGAHTAAKGTTSASSR